MSSRITSLLMISSLIFAFGCGKKDDDKGDKKKNSELVDTTNYATCNGTPRPGASIFNNGWQREAVQGNVQISQIFYVSNQGLTTVRQSCSMNGIGASMDVSTQSSVLGNTLTIAQTESSFTIDMGNGQELDCHIVVGALTNAKFKFVGPCLHITNNDGQTYQFVPAN